jgi:hypothetical protein
MESKATAKTPQLSVDRWLTLHISIKYESESTIDASKITQFLEVLELDSKEFLEW